MQSLSLADTLTLEPAPAGADGDELLCPGVAGAPADNLAARALSEFRRRARWDRPPLRLSVEKRIPVAAGLAGGSADAAATLRLARRASGLGDDALLGEIAAALGADVPAQLKPGRWLASGAGELLAPLPAPAAPLYALLLPAREELSTAAVYAEADRLGSPRSTAALEGASAALAAALAHGAPLPARRELLQNDLQLAATSLCPPAGDALEQARSLEPDAAFVCGSGPTVAALFAGEHAHARLERARALVQGRVPAAIACEAVDAGCAAATALE